MPVAMQHYDARGVGLNGGKNVGGVNQGQSHALMQADGGGRVNTKARNSETAYR